MDNIRFVVTSSDNISQQWQSELLLHSYRKVGHTEPITFLCASNNSKAKYVPKNADVFITPLYENVVRHHNYVMYNRIFGLEQYIKEGNFTEEYIVVIDPDMVFTKKFDYLLPEKGSSLVSVDCCRRFIHQDVVDIYLWYSDRGILNNCVFNVCPYVFHKQELMNILEDWKVLTIQIKNDAKYRNIFWGWEWTSDLIALDIVAYENKMKFVPIDSWHNAGKCRFEDEKSKPITHYFDPFSNISNTWHFYKHHFRYKRPENLIVPHNLQPIHKHLMGLMVEVFGGSYTDNQNIIIDYKSTPIQSTFFIK